MYLGEDDLLTMAPKNFRNIVRGDEWTGGTRKACRGYIQTNVTILPKEYADEFRLFCTRNPRPCPIIDVTEPGNPHPSISPEADLRTDLTRYKVFKDGDLVDEPTNISQYWRDDLVGFLLGCSYSFDWLLATAGIEFHFLGAFITNIQCEPAGRFKGPMVVTCRQFKTNKDAAKATRITSRYPTVHGPPIHVGEPAAIGIKDINQPDFSPPLDFRLKSFSIPIFWGCGITTEMTVNKAKLPIMITQGDNDLLVTDRLISSYSNEYSNLLLKGDNLP